MNVRNFIQDGEEMNFGRGEDGSSIGLPDPRLCNLHLAVARVFAASGFAEVVDRIMKDGEDDGSVEFEDELSGRLAALLVWG